MTTKWVFKKINLFLASVLWSWCIVVVISRWVFENSYFFWPLFLWGGLPIFLCFLFWFPIFFNGNWEVGFFKKFDFCCLHILNFASHLHCFPLSLFIHLFSGEPFFLEITLASCNSWICMQSNHVLLLFRLAWLVFEVTYQSIIQKKKTTQLPNSDAWFIGTFLGTQEMIKLNDISHFFSLLFAFAFWWFGVRSSGLFFAFMT